MSRTQANGNWYEGGWREGRKSGRGKLYYPDKGQLYEGFWVDGDAKCGTLSDFGRDEAAMLTTFPIPQVKHFKLWNKSDFLISKTSVENCHCCECNCAWFLTATAGGLTVGVKRSLVSCNGGS